MSAPRSGTNRGIDYKARRLAKAAEKAPRSPHADAPRLVLGLQPVREVIRARGRRVGSVLVEESRGDAGGRLDALARFAADQGVGQVQRVPRSTLDHLAQGTLHQGAAAWSPELEFTSAEEILCGPDLLVLALDGLQDPQNFGAAVRSAVGLGASAVVWPESASAPLSAATFRASAGAIEHARLCRVPSLVRFLDEARAAGVQCVGLAPDGPAPLHQADLRGPTVCVVGSEHEGLGRAVRQRCHRLCRVTLRGPVESLNASVAAALALHVALIQRSQSRT
jgi:23S rRNA (guanosine2251-2'-O)-methyltransferase